MKLNHNPVMKKIIRCPTVYQEFFASGNFGENDARKVF